MTRTSSLLLGPLAHTSALLLLFVCAPAAASDSDSDGIDDATEAKLLSAWAPVWRPDQADDRQPPLPIRWYVEHCSMYEFHHAQRDVDYNGTDDPGTQVSVVQDLNLESALSLARTRPAPRHYLRLGFKDGRYRNGWDPTPTSRRTWTVAAEKQDCLYGRCTRLAGARDTTYLLQYYLFFGWNDVDADRFLGCPVGNHEGDIICVEMEISYGGTQLSRGQLTRAVYHNHGRQVFADSPSALRYSQERPVVYLEKETQEPLPWSGQCGLGDPGMAQCTGANRYFASHLVGNLNDSDPYDYIAGECDSAPVVRTHLGRGPALLITNVINLGERGFPGDHPEVQFIHAFEGLYGKSGTACCDIIFIFETCQKVDSPRGPLFQDKMWARAWADGKDVPNRDFRVVNFPGCPDPGNPFRAPRTSAGPSTSKEVWVDFRYSGYENGSSVYPFNTLGEALGRIGSGDLIRIRAGSSAERPTIRTACEIQAPNGVVTIGQ